MKTMWRVHGPKIAGQTREQIDAIIARAERESTTSEALRELRRRLP
jgi:hypothetical protein